VTLDDGAVGVAPHPDLPVGCPHPLFPVAGAAGLAFHEGLLKYEVFPVALETAVIAAFFCEAVIDANGFSAAILI
jgi:hypothetical protein